MSTFDSTPAQVVAAVEDLKVWFPTTRSSRRSMVRAVDGISFEVLRGETLGLVGETGSGKSTTGLAMLRLVEPTAGRIRIMDEDVTHLSRRRLRRLRRRVAMVFQDSQASLDPRRTVAESIREPIYVQGLRPTAKARHDRGLELLDLVGLHPRTGEKRPFELSGGQRQRVGIARALAGEPELIVLDEPLSSLDVSVQAQIMNLLRTLQRELGLTYVFIAHDLNAVAYMSNRVAVMHLGRIVESAEAKDLYRNPQHPYTKALLSAIPLQTPAEERRRRQVILVGEAPSPLNPPDGCRFHTRCPVAIDACSHLDPPDVRAGPNHTAACLLVGKGDTAAIASIST